MAKSPNPNSLAELSTDAIHKELAKRGTKVGRLIKKRERMVGRLADLDAKIRLMGGGLKLPSAPVPGRGPGRPRNSEGLVHALVKLLTGKTMSVKDAADAVKKAGYHTNAVNFRVIVNQAFIKHKDLFKKISHGKYTAV